MTRPKSIRMAVFPGVAAACLLFAALAAATVGGPTTIRLLGVDRETGRVYLVNNPPYGEGVTFAVQWFDPGAAGIPVRTERALWEKGAREEDLSQIRGRIEEFRRSLEPLRPFSPANWEMQVELVVESVHEDPHVDRAVPRYDTRVRIAADGMEATFEVTSYCDRAASVLGWYRVPGDPGAAVVEFAFTGDPFETCYTTVVPVVLRVP